MSLCLTNRETLVICPCSFLDADLPVSGAKHLAAYGWLGGIASSTIDDTMNISWLFALIPPKSTLPIFLIIVGIP